MKFFMLYSAKYKKRVSNLRRGKMPLFTVLSFRTSKSAENLKIISTNSWKSGTQCMFYIRPLYRRRTTEGDYNTSFRCFRTKSWGGAMRPGKWIAFGKGHVTFRMLSISKRDCFLVCFVQNISYLVGTSWYYNNIKRSGKYSSDFVQNFAEKNTSIAV